MKCLQCPVTGGECAGLKVRRFCELIDPTHEAYDPRYRDVIVAETKRQQEYPSLAQQTRNLWRDMLAFARSGGKLAPRALRRARLATCESCNRWDAQQRRCTVCGCKTDAKVYSLVAQCPEGKWPG